MCKGGGLGPLINKLDPVSKIDPVGKAITKGLTNDPPPAPVDPSIERRKAEAEATARVNARLVDDARRKRSQRGLLASPDDSGTTILASGASPANSTVLGSGGNY